MLDDDALEQGGRHAGIPNAVRIDDDDRSAATNAKAGRLATFDPIRAKQEPLPLQERGQQAIQLATAMIGRTKAADANEHVAGVWVHRWLLFHGRSRSCPAFS